MGFAFLAVGKTKALPENMGSVQLVDALCSGHCGFSLSPLLNRLLLFGSVLLLIVLGPSFFLSPKGVRGA